MYPMSIRRSSVPGWTALAYVFMAIGWLLFADYLFDWLDDGIPWARLHSTRGAFFVAATAGMLFFLLRKILARASRAEERLREYEGRWREALEQTGDGIALIDLVTGHCTFSPRWKMVLGYAESELGDSVEEWESRIHPEDRAEVIARMKRLSEGAESHCRCEYRMRTKAGHYKWFLDRGHRFAALSDRPEGTILIQRSDIHEAKLIERTQNYLAGIELPESPREFLNDMARFLAGELSMAMVMIGRYEEEAQEVTVIAGYRDGAEFHGFNYKLAGTPCANVTANEFCHYPAGVRHNFPDDAWLAENGIESYAGVPLLEPVRRTADRAGPASGHGVHGDRIPPAALRHAGRGRAAPDAGPSRPLEQGPAPQGHLRAHAVGRLCEGSGKPLHACERRILPPDGQASVGGARQEQP
jgi:PAS domain S-box-containing protein